MSQPKVDSLNFQVILNYAWMIYEHTYTTACDEVYIGYSYLFYTFGLYVIIFYLS